MTRRFSVVGFDEVRIPSSSVVGEVGSADAQVDRQLERAVAISNAETSEPCRRPST